jgi:hypothetical protein
MEREYQKMMGPFVANEDDEENERALRNSK